MLFLSTRSSLELRSLIFLANTLFSSLIDSSPFDPSALMPFLCTRSSSVLRDLTCATNTGFFSLIRSSDIRVALRFLSRVIKDTARTVCGAYLTYDKLGRYVRHGNWRAEVS